MGSQTATCTKCRRNPPETKPTVVAVVGSSGYTDVVRIYRELDRCREAWGNFCLITGDPRGPNRIALHWAQQRGVRHMNYSADYAAHGPTAGYRRNQILVDAADVLVCYWDGVSAGVGDTIRRARAARKRVFVRPIVADDSSPPVAERNHAGS